MSNSERHRVPPNIPLMICATIGLLVFLVCLVSTSIPLFWRAFGAPFGIGAAAVCTFEAAQLQRRTARAIARVKGEDTEKPQSLIWLIFNTRPEPETEPASPSRFDPSTCRYTANCEVPMVAAETTLPFVLRGPGMRRGEELRVSQDQRQKIERILMAAYEAGREGR